jgi:hypothetical protein
MDQLERFHETLNPIQKCSFAIILKHRNLTKDQVQQMLDINSLTYGYNNLFWVKQSGVNKQHTFFAAKLRREGAESFCKSFNGEIFESWKSVDEF